MIHFDDCDIQVVNKKIHITKRDLFYTDVKLFKKQEESDGVLDDVACMIGCTRTNLNVVASDKGVVVGRVTFREDGDFIDCTKMGVRVETHDFNNSTRVAICCYFGILLAHKL